MKLKNIYKLVCGIILIILFANKSSLYIGNFVMYHRSHKSLSCYTCHSSIMWHLCDYSIEIRYLLIVEYGKYTDNVKYYIYVINWAFFNVLKSEFFTINMMVRWVVIIGLRFCFFEPVIELVGLFLRQL